MNTLPNSSQPYDSLEPNVCDDLLTVIHYLLLFHAQIGISEYYLLYPKLENSLLDGREDPFTSLVQHVCTQLSQQLNSKTVVSDMTALTPSERVSRLSLACASRVGEEDMRTHLFTKEDTKERQVVLGARLRHGARDGSGVGYTWIRGMDGCASCRVQAGDRVWAGSDILTLAQAIDIRGKCGGGRADIFVASWLNDRVERAQLRANRILEDWDSLQESLRRKERKKVTTLTKMGVDDEGCITVDGQRVAVGEFGRGKRERRQVCYDDTVVRDNETVDFLDDNSGDDDGDGDIENDASGDDESGEEYNGEAAESDEEDDDMGDVDHFSDDDDHTQDDVWSNTGYRKSRRLQRHRDRDDSQGGTRSGKSRRNGDGSWAQKTGPRAEGRFRVDLSDDTEEDVKASSRAVRAARRQQLRDG